MGLFRVTFRERREKVALANSRKLLSLCFISWAILVD